VQEEGWRREDRGKEEEAPRSALYKFAQLWIGEENLMNAATGAPRSDLGADAAVRAGAQRRTSGAKVPPLRLFQLYHQPREGARSHAPAAG